MPPRHSPNQCILITAPTRSFHNWSIPPYSPSCFSRGSKSSGYVLSFREFLADVNECNRGRNMDLKVVGELWEYVINVHFKEIAEEDKIRALLTRFSNDPSERVRVEEAEGAMVPAQVPEELNDDSEFFNGSSPGTSTEMEEVSERVNMERESRLKIGLDGSEDREGTDDDDDDEVASNDWDENLEYGESNEERGLSDNEEERGASIECKRKVSAELDTEFEEDAYWSYFHSPLSPSQHIPKRPRLEEQIKIEKPEVGPTFQLYEATPVLSRFKAATASTQFHDQENAIIVSGIQDGEVGADMKIIDLLFDLNPLSLQMGSEFLPAHQQELKTEFGITSNFALVTMRSVTSQGMALQVINVTAGLRDSEIRGWKAKKYSSKQVFREGLGCRESLAAKNPQPSTSYTSLPPEPPVLKHEPTPTSTTTLPISSKERKRMIKVWVNLASAVASARNQLKGRDREIFEELIAKPKQGEDVLKKIDEWVNDA